MLIESHSSKSMDPFLQPGARPGWSRHLAAGGQAVAIRTNHREPPSASSAMPLAVITIAHTSALVTAGLAAMLRDMPDFDVRIWSDSGSSLHRGPHESAVRVVIGDAVQVSDVLALAPCRSGEASSRDPRVVLIRSGDDVIEPRLASTMQVDAWLSVECSADELFATVHRLCTRVPPSLPGARSVVPVRGGLAPGALRRVREHIHQRLAERIELSDLAQIAGLSECHFARAFKQSIGMPPHRYMLQRRIEAAALMIERTDRPLSEIALDVGFSDQSHFTRMFSRLTRQTPREFRHQRR